MSRSLEEVFQERVPPREILLDNATAFRSQTLTDLCEKWGVHFAQRIIRKETELWSGTIALLSELLLERE